jgi:hypothetical protein
MRTDQVPRTITNPNLSSLYAEGQHNQMQSILRIGSKLVMTS